MWLLAGRPFDWVRIFGIMWKRQKPGFAWVPDQQIVPDAERIDAMETIVRQLADKALEKPKTKTADRPHNITIVLGASSTLISMTALLFSLVSFVATLRMSQQKTKLEERG